VVSVATQKKKLSNLFIITALQYEKYRLI